jgi:hypothetical protein
MLQYVIDQLEAKRKTRPTSTPTLTSSIITTITAITKPTRLTKKPKIKSQCLIELLYSVSVLGLPSNIN